LFFPSAGSASNALLNVSDFVPNASLCDKHIKVVTHTLRLSRQRLIRHVAHTAPRAVRIGIEGRE
jgi:hypothetical protein